MFFPFCKIGMCIGLIAFALAVPAQAGGTLKGRLVTMNVETYDVDGTPIFISKGRSIRVGDYVEFDLLPENGFTGLDVVPVRIEISDDRIEFSYGEMQGWFYQPAKFNGYVLRFEAECALFESAQIDQAFTTFPLNEDAIAIDGGALSINVVGLPFGPIFKFALDVKVSDCLLG